MPKAYPAERTRELENEASLIKQVMANMRGISTYRIYWNMYTAWYRQWYHAPPPNCVLTGLIWTNFLNAKDCFTKLAAGGLTYNQVRMHSCAVHTDCCSAQLTSAECTAGKCSAQLTDTLADITPPRVRPPCS